jgi:nucleotide-binding universal stress UspA family protein
LQFIISHEQLAIREAAMNFKKILVAIDFSPCSQAALEYATRLASDTGAGLYIVHVDELLDVSIPAIPPFEGGYVHESMWDERKQVVRDQLAKVVQCGAGVLYDYRCLMGTPAYEILKLADREHVDLIVIGSHGRTGISRLTTGSVAEGVMRRATCPVLMVKLPTKPPDSASSVGTAEAVEAVSS